MAFENLARWEWWLVMVISILVLTLTLYLSIRLICGRKKLTGGYFLRLLLVSIILLIVVVLVAEGITALISIGGTISQMGAMFYVFLTIGFILTIRYLLIVPAVLPYREYSAEKYWQWAIWITIISLIILLLIAFAIYYISEAAGNPISLFTPI